MSLSVSAVLTTTITGRNGSGSISLPGAKVGDVVFVAVGYNIQANGGEFEATISVNDQIQQVDGGNLSTTSIPVWLFRPQIAVC